MLPLVLPSIPDALPPVPATLPFALIAMSPVVRAYIPFDPGPLAVMLPAVWVIEMLPTVVRASMPSLALAILPDELTLTLPLPNTPSIRTLPEALPAKFSVMLPSDPSMTMAVPPVMFEPLRTLRVPFPAPPALTVTPVAAALTLPVVVTVILPPEDWL